MVDSETFSAISSATKNAIEAEMECLKFERGSVAWQHFTNNTISAIINTVEVSGTDSLRGFLRAYISSDISLITPDVAQKITGLYQRHTQLSGAKYDEERYAILPEIDKVEASLIRHLKHVGASAAMAATSSSKPIRKGGL